MMTAATMYRFRDNGAATSSSCVQDLYEGLYSLEPERGTYEASQAYLTDCLAQTSGAPCDLPADWNDLERWAGQRHERVGQQYLDYLKQRTAGAPRRYFASRSHALYFLQGVSPTKFVDGAWL